jgi:trimethylamine:corrinoid methyltransferase-like protein
MKTAGLLTKLSDRDTRTQWEKKGARDIQVRAMARVREILAKPSSTIFSPEVEERIRAHFTDLISAEMEVPEGLQVVAS